MAGLTASAAPLAAQEVIELPGEDRLLDADFEEIYRLGSVDGGGWDTFGSVEDLGFDGAGNLYILDTTGRFGSRWSIRRAIWCASSSVRGRAPASSGATSQGVFGSSSCGTGALPGGGVAYSDSSTYAIKFTAPGGPRDPDRDPAVPAQARNGPNQIRGDRASAGVL